MSPSTPLITADGQIDTPQVLAEAIPIAKLILLVAAVALVPGILVFALGGTSPVGIVFVIAMQFVLAVGGAIVLLYVITRAIQLADR